MKVLDRILLGVVQWRLARCKRYGDSADRFGDKLARALLAEDARRRIEVAGYVAASRDASARGAAQQSFEELQPGDAGLRLQ